MHRSTGSYAQSYPQAGGLSTGYAQDQTVIHRLCTKLCTGVTVDLLFGLWYTVLQWQTVCALS